MDFDSFLEIVKLLPHDVSVILRGRHGIGKSEVVYQLAEDYKLPVMERRISQMTEGDLIGLPFKEDSKYTSFLPLKWFKQCMEGPFLIFLDEVDRGSPEVQQACFELTLDRRIQGNKIHPDCRIYSATNGGIHSAKYNINEMDPAMVDRFWVADIEPSLEDWLKWARESGKVHPKIIDFINIERKGSPLEHTGDIEQGKIYPSRRSWARLSKTLSNHPQLLNEPKKKGNMRLIQSIAHGFVGDAATSMFKKFLSSDRIFTAEDIINNFNDHRYYFESAETKRDVPLLNNIINKICHHIETKKITKAQMNNMYEFWSLMLGEQKQQMYAKITTSRALASFDMKLQAQFIALVADEMVDLLN